MHIAQIAPLKRHGGDERVICWLAEELVALGHEVTLYVGGGSAASDFNGLAAKDNALHVRMLERIRKYSNRYDILHFHSNNNLFSGQSVPFLTTLYGNLNVPECRPIFDTFSQPPIISLSNAQRRPVPHANWVRTIYPGLPQQFLAPVPAEPHYFAALGSIVPGARVDRAISVARKCGIPIRIAGEIPAEGREYFNGRIRPLLDGSSADYVGEITDADKAEFLGEAVALLDLHDSPQPSCLNMIEAMACGTPVIAFDRGSVPEIVENGWTGFIIDDENDAIDAVGRLFQLSRESIRSRFEQRFTVRQMALEYLDVYRGLMDCDIYRFKPEIDGVTATQGVAAAAGHATSRSRARPSLSVAKQVRRDATPAATKSVAPDAHALKLRRNQKQRDFRPSA